MRKAKTMSKQETDAEKDSLAEAVPASNTGISDAPAFEAGSLDTAIERGGPKGPEPTRFGDWENNGRCTDF